MDFRNFLIQEGLIVLDPYGQPGLRQLEKVTAAVGSVVLENKYIVHEEKIFCHICGGKRHNKGITGRLPDGTAILFGSQCARLFFGPQVWNTSMAALKRAQEGALARFRLYRARHCLDGAERWLQERQTLIANLEIGWCELQRRYPEPLKDICDHLAKNSGRLVEASEERGHSDGEGPKGSFFVTRIILSVRDWDAFRHLEHLSAHRYIVESFIDRVRWLTALEHRDQITRLDQQFGTKVMDSVQILDRGISFGTDFFAPGKLEAIGEWSDRLRERRLKHLETVTPRDLGALMRRLVGFGHERPTATLESQFAKLDFLAKLPLADKAKMDEVS